MPQKPSAAKAMRKSQKAYAKNTILRKKIKDARKKAEKALAAKSHAEALKMYAVVQKLVDKASKSFMPKNAAARYKANLMKKINALK